MMVQSRGKVNADNHSLVDQLNEQMEQVLKELNQRDMNLANAKAKMRRKELEEKIADLAVKIELAGAEQRRLEETVQDLRAQAEKIPSSPAGKPTAKKTEPRRPGSPFTGRGKAVEISIPNGALSPVGNKRTWRAPCDVEFLIYVTNRGTTPLEGVKVRCTPGEGLSPTAASEGYKLLPDGVDWTIESLYPGELVQLQMVCRTVAGTRLATLSVVATTPDGDRAETKRGFTIEDGPRAVVPIEKKVGQAPRA